MTQNRKYIFDTFWLKKRSNLNVLKLNHYDTLAYQKTAYENTMRGTLWDDILPDSSRM